MKACMHKTEGGTAERILNCGGGGGLTSELRRRQLVGGSGNPPPEIFEILKLGNATFII